MNSSPANLSSFGVAKIDFGTVHGVAQLRFVEFVGGSGSLEAWFNDGRWVRNNEAGTDWFTATRVDPFKPGNLWPKPKSE
jgi:hypothetical protein